MYSYYYYFNFRRYFFETVFSCRLKSWLVLQCLNFKLWPLFLLSSLLINYRRATLLMIKICKA